MKRTEIHTDEPQYGEIKRAQLNKQQQAAYDRALKSITDKYYVVHTYDQVKEVGLMETSTAYFFLFLILQNSQIIRHEVKIDKPQPRS